MQKSQEAGKAPRQGCLVMHEKMCSSLWQASSCLLPNCMQQPIAANMREMQVCCTSAQQGLGTHCMVTQWQARSGGTVQQSVTSCISACRNATDQ